MIFQIKSTVVTNFVQYEVFHNYTKFHPLDYISFPIKQIRNYASIFEVLYYSSVISASKEYFGCNPD